MKVFVYRTSGKFLVEKPCQGATPTNETTRFPWAIEINSLDDILALAKEVKCEIIVHGDYRE